MKEYSKLKKNRKAGEMYAEDIRVPLITPTEIDLFSKVEDLQSASRLYLWIDLGGAFLTSEEDAATFKNAKKFVDDFAVYAEKKHVEELLGGAEKDLKGLGKDKESYEKAIEKAKEQIAKMERNLEENAVSQEAKVTEIEDQKGLLIKIQERLAAVGKNKTKM
jgi:valyl-tRNA synthetase